MGFRFRRSIKIAPGIRLNLSKRGKSLSIGGRGATTNISKRGVRETFGIPGTGLSYSRMVGKRKKKVSHVELPQPSTPAGKSGGGGGRKLGLGCGGVPVLVVLLAVCSNIGGNKAGQGAASTSAASREQSTPAASLQLRHRPRLRRHRLPQRNLHPVSLNQIPPARSRLRCP